MKIQPRAGRQFGLVLALPSPTWERMAATSIAKTTCHRWRMFRPPSSKAGPWTAVANGPPSLTAWIWSLGRSGRFATSRLT